MGDNIDLEGDEANIDEISYIDEEYENEEEDRIKKDKRLALDKSTYQRLKKNDPTVTHLLIQLDENYLFNNINWKEDGDCISANSHLQMLKFNASMDRSYNQHDNTTIYSVDKCYILGQEGHNLPARQQLQDFFSCIGSSSFDELCFTSISINDKFAGELIFKGLGGHTSLRKLEIAHARLGRIGCKALGKVLNQPKSKLIDLCLDYTYLDDESLGIVCDALLGNGKMKRLSLSGNKSITSDGWQALSAVIQHPNCQLVVLELQDTFITDDELDILGSALHHSSSMKTLKLNYNDHISNTGWQMLLNQISQTSIRNLDLSESKIDDACLAALANMGGKLKSLDLSENGNETSSTTLLGWESFFSSLKSRGCQLVNLNICGNKVGDAGIASLGALLSNKMKTLDMSDLDTDDGSTVSSQGWVSFFRALQDSNLDLKKLNLHSNQIDDEGMQILVSLISDMSSLTHLGLGRNYLVTSAGWQSLANHLQSPNCALEELELENNLDDETLVAFARILVHDKTLRRLIICQDDDLITETGWQAVSNLICNKESVMDTYSSNHTLHDIPYMNVPDNLVSSLTLNKNEDKLEVARQKILRAHFSNDSPNMQELLHMELEMMPTVIAWIGRPAHIGWKGTNVSGLSAMFNLTRKVPDLFDSSAQKKLSGTKRARSMQTGVDESL